MVDADFTALLIHQCTIQRRAAAEADELGHTKGDYADFSLAVSCRLAPFTGAGRFTERTADTKALLGDYLLMVEPDTEILQGDQVTDVTMASDSSVVNAGPFSVLRIERGEGDAADGLHHLEAQLDLVSASVR